MDINTLTEEQRAKARACTTADELIQLAKEEGVELSDDQLAAVNGGVVTAPCGEHGGGSTWSE